MFGESNHNTGAFWPQSSSDVNKNLKILQKDSLFAIYCVLVQIWITKSKIQLGIWHKKLCLQVTSQNSGQLRTYEIRKLYENLKIGRAHSLVPSLPSKNIFNNVNQKLQKSRYQSFLFLSNFFFTQVFYYQPYIFFQNCRITKSLKNKL